MRLAGAVLLAVLALVAAGCGGSKSTDSTTEDTTAIETNATETDTTTTETTADETTETDTTTTETMADETTETDTTTTETTADETTETDTTEIDTTSAAGADQLANLLGSEECASLVGLSATLAQAMSAAAGSDEQLGESTKFFEELASKAPEEIRGDFAVLSDAFAKIGKAYAGLNLKEGEVPNADTLKKLGELGKELDNDKVRKASSNIEAWTKENCKSGG